LNGLGHFGGVARDEVDRDARVRPTKADQLRREPIARDRLARIDRKRAALETGDFRQGELRCLGACQDGVRLVEKQTTRISELDPPAHPAEQRDAVACIERSDRGAHCGLGEVERVGGARHVLAFGNGGKNFEAAQASCVGSCVG